jgi:probable phosphoglycerate mutase
LDIGHSNAFPRIFLIRHGETAWSLSGQHTGNADIPLTEHGEAKARGLVARLSGVTYKKVLTSPLQRARRTAELAGFPKAEPDAGLVEWNYGKYEGLRTAEIRAERPDWNLFRDGCPGGESPDQISARADQVIQRLCAIGGDVLLFAHQDILRVLAIRWLREPAIEGRHFVLATASLSILGYNHNLDEPVIRLWNENHP